MPDRIAKAADTLMEHYVFALLVLGQAALTQFGVGNAASVGMVGVLLCAAGLGLHRAARIDLWAAVPMAGYCLWGAVSSWAALGNPVAGYPATHVIFLTLYFLMACMDAGELRLLKRLYALWAGCAAAISLAMFLFKALTGTAGRLGGLLGNPNALGTFLVVGWFALLACQEEDPEGQSVLTRALRRMEPIVLVVLSLTLSMGSFLAMAAGIGVLLLERRRQGFLALARVLLAKASVCFAAGFLMYLTARQTRIPWFCLVLTVWLLALSAHWEVFLRFLRTYAWAAAALAAGGVLVAAAAVAVRPSALATFAERLEMMENGLHYAARSPLLGLGPGMWREWNLHEGGTYFGTWHIHNFLIHTAAELGLPAMLMLLAVLVRHFRKSGSPAAAAFVFHNLMDTTFFSLGVTSLTLVSMGEPGKGGTALSMAVTKGVFVLMLVHFIACMVSFWIF